MTATAKTNQSVIQVRVDNSLRRDVDDMFKSLGMSTQTAIKIFLNKSIERGGMPFDVVREVTYDRLNQDTLDAIAELDEMSGQGGMPVDDFLKEMHSWR